MGYIDVFLALSRLEQNSNRNSKESMVVSLRLENKSILFHFGCFEDFHRNVFRDTSYNRCCFKESLCS